MKPSHQVQSGEQAGTVSLLIRGCTRSANTFSEHANILQRASEHFAAGAAKPSRFSPPSPPPDKKLGKECLNLSNCKDTTLTLRFASFGPSVFICIQKNGKDNLRQTFRTT